MSIHVLDIEKLSLKITPQHFAKIVGLSRAIYAVNLKFNSSHKFTYILLYFTKKFSEAKKKGGE